MIRVSVNSMAKIQQKNRVCTVPNDQAYPQCVAKVEVSQSTYYHIPSVLTILCVPFAVHQNAQNHGVDISQRFTKEIRGVIQSLVTWHQKGRGATILETSPPSHFVERIPVSPHSAQIFKFFKIYDIHLHFQCFVILMFRISVQVLIQKAIQTRSSFFVVFA